MTVEGCTIDGVFAFRPIIHHDDRGWFSRTLETADLARHGLNQTWSQHSQSRSRRGVLRGLHVRAGIGEAKMFRCARGAVFEIVVDVRPWSASFMVTEEFRVDDDSMTHLYLPRGVAHGFQAVSDFADVCYLHEAMYEPGSDIAFAWNDPRFDIAWPITPPILSNGDTDAPGWATLDWTTLLRQM